MPEIKSPRPYFYLKFFLQAELQTSGKINTYFIAYNILHLKFMYRLAALEFFKVHFQSSKARVYIFHLHSVVNRNATAFLFYFRLRFVCHLRGIG